MAESSEAFRRETNFGFRCMQHLEPPEPTAGALDPIPEPVEVDFSKLAPCSDDVFSVIRGIYSYSKSDLESKIEFRREYSEYAMLEKVSFWDAFRKYRVLAYIFLPRKSQPPFQAVMYYPSADAWYLDSISDYPLGEGELHFKHGRAFIFPVLTGTFERKEENPKGIRISSGLSSQERRDRLIRNFQDMARCLDYLETRPADFRADKIAFQGISSGAIISPLFGALETRLRAMVAIGGGIWSSGGQLIPGFAELDMVNFLPRVKLPFLLVNGRYDLLFPGGNEPEGVYGSLGNTAEGQVSQSL